MLKEHCLETNDLSRRIWTRIQTGPAKRLCVVLDAEIYLDRMDAEVILSEFESTGFVFVSNVSAEARHVDFVCSEAYARFLATEVVAWGCAEFGLPETGHAIVGLSLSGLQSCFTGLLYPEIFTHILCQSGSFWWNDEWLASQTDLLGSFRGMFWLSAGDREAGAGAIHEPSGMRQTVDQWPSVQRMADTLTGSGHDVHFHLFSGGHELEPWKAELSRALKWLGLS